MLGSLVAKVGIPSFVVTLAAFLAFQGVVLLLVQGGTIISIRDDDDPGDRQQNLPPAAGLGPAGRRASPRYAARPAAASRSRAARGPDRRPDLADRGPGRRRSRARLGSRSTSSTWSAAATR